MVTHYLYENYFYKHFTRSNTTTLICIIGFFLGLPFVMEGGFYLFDLVDENASNPCFLICMLQSIVVWKYIGIEAIQKMVANKTGKVIPNYVYQSIYLISPLVNGVLFFLSMIEAVYII